MDAYKNFGLKLKNITECSICFEIISQPKLLPCNHSFCYQCLTKFSRKSFESEETLCCPLCRKKILKNIEYLSADILLTRLIDFFESTGGSISKDLRSKNYDLALTVDHMAKLKSQVINSKTLSDECFKKIRQDVHKAKFQLQEKLDRDYTKAIVQKLDEMESDRSRVSSHYLTTINDLMGDIPIKPSQPFHNEVPNPFLFSKLSFHPSGGIISENNLIGELQGLSDDGSTAQSANLSSTSQLSLLGVLTLDDSIPKKTTVGVAITKSFICTIQVLSHIVHLFDIISLKFVKVVRAPNLRNPQDMCGCPRRDRLYVADSYNDTLHMLDLESDDFRCWPLELEPTNISTCWDKRAIVWVACKNSDGLLEMDGETGKQLRKIDLQSQILGVGHVLSLGCPQIGDKVLVLCHGVLVSDYRHQVLVLDNRKGKLMPDWSFGNTAASGKANLSHPCYLAPVIDSKTNYITSILVADQSNKRIVQLHFPTMNFMTAFNDFNGTTFKNPHKVVYDSTNHLLIVVENDTEGSTLIFHSYL